ncbi:mariner mos1 transposase [Plakobranchus ocellatus]|uniref:Mariner mos1 transposase n=1 Tax=Plakobranchus ocellatus TaxID=259542 RepID=A0AAV3Z032_9GAST|nr:mariner mos1 transposase [Plakobranchus ocellatus]
MIIPAVFVVFEPEKTAYLVTKGNETTWAGFNVDILNLLSKALGFTALPFAVTDGGFYGLYEPDGDVLGVVGYRISKLNLERGWGTDVDGRGKSGEIKRRVERQKPQLGDLLSELVKGRTGVFLLLIGPCVALISGLVVFLVNGVLVDRTNVFGRKNLRRLYDFPLHYMFQTAEPYSHQSGRILQASWDLFCVAMFASYGSLLTSNAAAPVEHPSISSLEDLLSYPDMAIGISPSSSRTITALSMAKPGTVYAGIWQTLIRLNESEASTFNPDKGYHVRRVLEGNYAFIGGIPKCLLPSLVDADFSDVRFFAFQFQQLYMAIPNNVFYKQVMERALLLVIESGILKSMLQKWCLPTANMKELNEENGTVIHLARLRLLLTLIAVALGRPSFV